VSDALDREVRELRRLVDAQAQRIAELEAKTSPTVMSAAVRSAMVNAVGHASIPSPVTIWGPRA
jgi:hypothetical protein